MTGPELKYKFPKHFLWGAATAAHQVEGGNHNQWTVWELENAKAKAVQSEYHKDPNNYVSGELADHYNRYKEDLIYYKKCI